MSREELQTLAGTLRRSALRLEHLVENLLDAGSIEAGTFQVRAVPASVRSCLQEAMVFTQMLLDSKHQRLEERLRPDSDRVLADPRRTAQVLANLIANASRYAPEDTTVTVATAARDRFVQGSLLDRGPGIP